VDATRTALITLITPVTSLGLGHFLNGEPLTLQILAGAGLVVLGLLVHEYGHRLSGRLMRLGRCDYGAK